MTFRSFVRATGLSVAALALSGTVGLAQSFPDRPLSLVVPFNPGGQTDIATRLLGEMMARELGSDVTIVNRGGAGGAIGSAEVAAAEPDGHFLGMVTSTPLVQAPHLSDTPYTVDSFEFICRGFNNPLLFLVDAGSDLATPGDLAALAQSGTTVRYGSSGPGSVQHLGMILFSEQAGIETVHVPNNSDADNLRNILADVITGTLVPASVARANADTVSPIGVMDTERTAAFPDVETFAEAGFPVIAAIWGVLAAPAGTPPERVEVLRDACRAAQATEEFATRMRELGMEPAHMDGEELEAFIRVQDEDAQRLLTELGMAQ